MWKFQCCSSMLFACLYLFFLQSACPKNLPGSDKVDRVEEGELGEETPIKNGNGVDRFSLAAKRETDECDDIPEDEKTICKLFLGVGKRELDTVVPSSKESPARRGLGRPLTRGFQPPCTPYPFCVYSPPGKKKFMVKKAARDTGHEEKVNAASSSDTNDNEECHILDLSCHNNGGVGRKRSIRPKLTKLYQDDCVDQEYSSGAPCRWPGGRRRKRTFSSLDDDRVL